MTRENRIAARLGRLAGTSFSWGVVAWICVHVLLDGHPLSTPRAFVTDDLPRLCVMIAMAVAFVRVWTRAERFADAVIDWIRADSAKKYAEGRRALFESDRAADKYREPRP